MDQLEATTIAWGIIFLIYAIDLGVRLFLLFYIPQNRKPTAAAAWLLAIYVVPLWGTLAFLLIGSTKLSKRRRRAQQQVDLMLKRYSRNLRKAGLSASIEPPHDLRAKLAESLTALAPSKRNAVAVLTGYDEIIEDMTRKVLAATSYVYVEFFAMALDDTTEPFFKALETARARGVEVYVLFDTLGSRKYKGYRAMKQRLTAMGAHWRATLPISLRPAKYNRPDLRNHRKILVIDNRFGYLGSLNMIEKTYQRKDDISYLELVSRLEGPAVNEAAAVFASDWYCETGVVLKQFTENTIPSKRGRVAAQVIPSGPGFPFENNLKYFTSMIHSARHSITITNPYLVPDEALLDALISAAQRGVHISILNSEAIDQWMVAHAQRSYYEALLQAGVEIHLYKKPQLVHEKFLVIDTKVGIIGSSNFDIRSFELNLECIVAAYDKTIARTLIKHHRALLAHSQRISLDSWRRRSIWSRFLDSIARLTSALQ